MVNDDWGELWWLVGLGWGSACEGRKNQKRNNNRRRNALVVGAEDGRSALLVA